jgi:hypothetical protein
MNYLGGNQMKQESKRNLSPLFLFFSISILFSACKGEFYYSDGGYWLKYQFVNESSYSIVITLDQEYKYTSGEDSMPYSSAISLNSGLSITVLVKDDSVDFMWTASNKSDNRYIYTVIDGSKVTFWER